MPDQNEIIAIFKADIEQYKATIAELSGVNKEVAKTTDEVTEATENFNTTSKSSAKSISTLSRGLGGITGLLGITGRLFGVNTEKLEGFIFASREFARVAKQISDSQKLTNLATKEGTAAKVADIAATHGQTAAQRIYALVVGQSTGAMAAFKVALAATGIGLAVIALTTLISSFKAATAATEAKEKAAKKLREENNKLNESIISVQRKEDELALTRATNTKQITEREAEELKAKSKNLEEVKKILGERELVMNKEGKLELIETDIVKKKLLTAERDYQTDLAAIRVKFDKLDKDDKDKEDEKQLKDQNASLEKQFNAFTKYWDSVDKQERDRQEKLRKIIEKEEDEKRELRLKKARDLQDQMEQLDLDSQVGFTEAAEKEKNKIREQAEKDRLKRIETEKEVLDTIFNAQEEAFDKRQALLDKEISSQEKNIDHQRTLAERGLDNTLAFEEKRTAELQRQQQLEAQKQKRIKLLETFLNSLAEYSKTNPDTALQKALLQVALAQAASAVFAEEGGIIGEIGERSNRSRRHKGGGDVLLHAQTGEGILSRREMDNLGKRNFHLLKDAARFPIRDDVFAMPKLVAAGGIAVSNADVVKEIKAMHHTLKNKKETHYDLKQNGEYMITQIENGLTQVTKGKLKKPRF